jgi:hypothetical protein
MPHEQPWINDTLKRHEAELQDQFELQEKKFAVINAAIKARLDAECNSNDCNGCGNAECVAAHKEYLKLWPENAAELIEQEKEPVSAVRTTSANTPAKVLPSPAQFRNSHEQKPSERPGIPASGLTLFDLVYDDEKEKAA